MAIERGDEVAQSLPGERSPLRAGGVCLAGVCQIEGTTSSASATGSGVGGSSATGTGGMMATSTRHLELTPGMSKREVEALVGRAPYGQDTKVQGTERWVYVNTSARVAWIVQFRGDALDWSRQQDTSPAWPNASMRR